MTTPALQLPRCFTKNTILDNELIERANAGDLLRLVVVTIPDARVSFLAAHFEDEPPRPIYLATRRDRKQPKLHVDFNRLLSNIGRDFPDATVEVERRGLDARPK